MMRLDRRLPPPQRFVSHFLMFSASPLLRHLHLTLMEKTYIAVWDKKRPHLSSNGACSWIMESQPAVDLHCLPFPHLCYTISRLSIHQTQIRLYIYMCVETVRVGEIYRLFKKKKHVKIVMKLQCGPCWVKRNTTKKDLIMFRFRALASTPNNSALRH